MNDKETEESKYIQQHLANERTYLAWVRTAIAIVGIGFLTTSLHYNIVDNVSKWGSFITIMISISSLVLGFVTIIGATVNYYRTRKNINTQTFKSSHMIITYMTVIVILIISFILFYFLVV
jgi:putative membrane protein